MPCDEGEDHAIERTVRFLEEERRLFRDEPTPARDVRDLSHETRAEEQECLSALAERQSVPARLDPVLASEHLGLCDELIAPGRACRVEMPEQEVAHAHAALAEPPKRVLIEAPVPILIGEVDLKALEDIRRNWPFLRDRRIDAYAPITSRMID